MQTRILFGLLGLTALYLCGCGDEARTSFSVHAKVRGINYAAMSQLSVIFSSQGSARFDAASGSRGDGHLQYETRLDGREFAAIGDQTWVTEHYVPGNNEFTFDIFFQNPSGSGEVEVSAEIHRAIGDDLVLVGTSLPVPAAFPLEDGAVLEIVVGCVEGAACGGPLPTDAGTPGPDSAVDSGVDSGLDSGEPGPDSGMDAALDAT